MKRTTILLSGALGPRLRRQLRADPRLRAGVAGARDHGRPIAGPGVKASLLSSVRIAGGASQVTCAGHPLYTFSDDSRGATDYVGVNEFGGNRDAVDAAGETVK
jgi:Secreted repeat of unknown function